MTALTPLEVVLRTMRTFWDAEDFAGALAAARVAIPYVHGRAPMARTPGEISGVPDDELDSWSGDAGEGDPGAAAPEGDPT